MGTDTGLKNGKKEKLTKRSEFEKVYQLGITKRDRLLVVRILNNKLNINRFGYSVSKKLGGAVTRNHIKRLFREIVRQAEIKQGYDIVVIARTGAIEAGFDRLKKSFVNLLGQYGLIINKYEDSSTKTY